MVLVSWRRHVDLDETINHLLARIAEMIGEFTPAGFNFLVKMQTVPIGASSTGVFTVEGYKLGKSPPLDLHLKHCIAGRNLKFTLLEER